MVDMAFCRTAALLAAALALSSNMVLAANDAPYLVNPCLNETFRGLPFCNVSLGIDERAADIISRLSAEDKIQYLGTDSPAAPEVGLSSYNWWSEATHGISHVRNTPTTPAETNFPLPITTACSFNRSLWRATGAQIGTEARAFMNAGNAYSTYWAPVINLVRDPRWGRNLETPGEDSYLSGEYAIQFVKGMQDNPSDPGHIMASACCKHYVANSMDSSTVDGTSWTRTSFDAFVPVQDMVDSYMPPFQACVEQGGVTGLMCSYNEESIPDVMGGKGIPSCANDWLLTTVARGEWGFDGYVTSDCDADANVYDPHHYTATPEEAVAAVLKAGTDVDCGGFVQQHGASALSKGLISEALIDERLHYLFRMRMRLGHFDPPGPLQAIPPSAVCTEESIALARDGTVQGSVLLKNAASTLPMDASALKTVAVIGPNYNQSKDIAGYYGGTATCEGKFWNMTDAVAQYVPGVVAMAGVPSVTSSDTSGIAAAAAAAAAADAVVMAVGQDLTIEREGHDRVNISMSDAQEQLIAAVAKAAKNPITVVILTGGAVDVSSLLANDKVGAVINAGYPSVTVLGVGDIIFGKAVPAGRMIQTTYPAAFADEVSIFDFTMRPGPSAWPKPGCTLTPPSSCPNGTNPGRTHRFYTGKPVLPFGYGLSYTTFSYKVVGSPTRVSLAPLRAALADAAEEGRMFVTDDMRAPLVEYTVEVTNTGTVDADDAVLGFLVPPGAGQNGTPLQQLFGFERVHVPAGATVTVYLAAGVRDFAQVDASGRRVAHPGEYKFRFGVEETRAHGQGFAEASLVAE